MKTSAARGAGTGLMTPPPTVTSPASVSPFIAFGAVAAHQPEAHAEGGDLEGRRGADRRDGNREESE